MVALKKLSSADAEAAKRAQGSRRIQGVCLSSSENYAMDAVQRDLNLILTQDQIDNGGLSIYTTLDPSVQNTAQDALERSSPKSSINPIFIIR